MSSVDERHQRLILDLLRNRISEADFRCQFPIEVGESGLAGLAMLERAIQAQDPVGVEFGLYLGHRFGISRDYLNVLIQLAGVGWHRRHEDVVDGLAKLKDSRSVGALYAMAVAQFPYREYDDASSLGVKAIYALGAIGNAESIARLGDLVRSRNAILASQAENQLSRIEGSAASVETRELARRILGAARSAGEDGGSR